MFPVVILSIPESRRSVRDRVLYNARFSGYRQLRPGVLIAITEAAEALRAEISADIGAEGRAWLDFCTLTPESPEQARRWAGRAFEIAALRRTIDESEARVAAALDDPGGLPFPRYFDLYYAVSGQLMSAPVLPPELAPDLDVHARLGTCMGMLNSYCWSVLAPEVLARVREMPSAELIEWEPREPAGQHPPAR